MGRRRVWLDGEQAFDVAPSGGHRRDAYDTLSSVTCGYFFPSQLVGNILTSGGIIMTNLTVSVSWLS
jgi:hypothetical protein